jgi:hypothetical protein
VCWSLERIRNMRNLPITASTPTRRDVARCPLAQDVAGALVGAVVGRRPARLGTGGPATVYGSTYGGLPLDVRRAVMRTFQRIALTTQRYWCWFWLHAAEPSDSYISVLLVLALEKPWAQGHWAQRESLQKHPYSRPEANPGLGHGLTGRTIRLRR